MCEVAATRRRVANLSNDKRETLRLFIQERRAIPFNGEKFNVARWAKAAGVNSNSIYNFLNGHSDSLDHITYAKLARAVGVPIHHLTGELPEPVKPSAIYVSGEVEAGAFRDALEWDRSRWFEVDIPVPSRFKSKAKALQVRGPSMDLEYPDGSIVVWVDQLDYRPAQHGDHVIVYSYRSDGAIESTVKELRVADGKNWLWPRSSHPAHQAPIEVHNPPEGVREITVQGIVIGGYRPRVH